MVLAEWQVGQVLWSMIWFTLFFMWIWLLIRVIGDIFRSEMSGAAKVLWLLFTFALPYLGVFVYLIARGDSMAERDQQAYRAQDAAMKDYIRSAAGTSSPADELERLAALKANGTIDEAEFARLKAGILG